MTFDRQLSQRLSREFSEFRMSDETAKRKVSEGVLSVNDYRNALAEREGRKMTVGEAMIACSLDEAMHRERLERDDMDDGNVPGQPLDYKELLKKYMQHVMDCEGFSFLMHASTKASAQYSVAFTEEELTELRTILCEVNDE